MFNHMVQNLQFWDVQESIFNVHAVKANKNGRNDTAVGQTRSVQAQHAVFCHYYISFLIGNLLEDLAWPKQIKTMFSK